MDDVFHQGEGMLQFLKNNLDIVSPAFLFLELISLVLNATLPFQEQKEKEISHLLLCHFLSIYFFIINTAYFGYFSQEKSTFFMIFGIFINMISMAFYRVTETGKIASKKRSLLFFIVKTAYLLLTTFLLSRFIQQSLVFTIFTIHLIFYLFLFVPRLGRSLTRLQKTFRLFRTINDTLKALSQWIHRIFGPILIEWLIIRIPAGVIVTVRISLRLFSYVSVQRTMATGIMIAVVIALFFLRN